MADGPGVYDPYPITSQFSDDTGRQVLPATKAGGEAGLIQSPAGLTTLTVEWSVSRTGSPPILPDTATDDPDIVHLRGTVGPEGVDLAADGVTPTYIVSGISHFAFLDRDKAVVEAPVPPFLAGSVAPAARLVAPDIISGSAGGRAVNVSTGTGTSDYSRSQGNALTDLIEGLGDILGGWGGRRAGRLRRVGLLTRRVLAGAGHVSQL